MMDSVRKQMKLSANAKLGIAVVFEVVLLFAAVIGIIAYEGTK